jgi:hypothetical protein
MSMPGAGVEIRMADGGYILQWMEARKAEPGAGTPPGYLEQEQHTLGGCFPGPHLHAPPRFKTAVRVKLEDALKLAGEILKRLQESGVDDDVFGGGYFIAGA